MVTYKKDNNETYYCRICKEEWSTKVRKDYREHLIGHANKDETERLITK